MSVACLSLRQSGWDVTGECLTTVGAELWVVKDDETGDGEEEEGNMDS